MSFQVGMSHSLVSHGVAAEAVADMQTVMGLVLEEEAIPNSVSRL
jgi:hypothetical protein